MIRGGDLGDGALVATAARHIVTDADERLAAAAFVAIGLEAGGLPARLCLDWHYAAWGDWLEGRMLTREAWAL